MVFPVLRLFYLVISLPHSGFGQAEYFPIQNGSELVYGEYSSEITGPGPGSYEYDTVQIRIDSLNSDTGFKAYRAVGEFNGIRVLGGYEATRPVIEPVIGRTNTFHDTLNLNFGPSAIHGKITINDSETDAVEIRGNTDLISAVFMPASFNDFNPRDCYRVYAKGWGLVMLGADQYKNHWHFQLNIVLKKKDGVDIVLKNTPEPLFPTEFPLPIPDSARPDYFPIHNGDVRSYSKFSSLPKEPGGPNLESMETLEVHFDSLIQAESSVAFKKTVMRTGILISTVATNFGETILSKDTLPIAPSQTAFWDTVSYLFDGAAKAGTMSVDGQSVNTLYSNSGIYPAGTTFFPDSVSSLTGKTLEWQSLNAEGFGGMEIQITEKYGKNESDYRLTKINGKEIIHPENKLQLYMKSHFPEIEKPSVAVKTGPRTSVKDPRPSIATKTFDLLGRWFSKNAGGTRSLNVVDPKP
jgi:hypothetical protein